MEAEENRRRKSEEKQVKENKDRLKVLRVVELWFVLFSHYNG